MFNDAEWQRLVDVLGRPEWATSIRFASQLSRKQNEAELDAVISDWTRSQDSAELMNKLQNAGVHAAKVNNMPDLFADPQLKERRFWRTVNHKEVGLHHAEMPAFNLSLTPAADPLPDPCLCEHTEMVLKKLLGLSDKEIEALSSRSGGTRIRRYRCRQSLMQELIRCAWAKTEPSLSYHDQEWGVPVHDDRLLFEFRNL